MKKIYIIAICGKAMASLAELLSQKGYQVSGSDQSFDPPMSQVLQNLKIPVFSGYNKQNVEKFCPDIIVVGNTIRPNNVETTYARQSNIPQMSVVEALRSFIFGNKKVIVVVGTHGKTTTTGLLVHVLKGCKLNPGYLIGGVDRVSGRCADLGEGEYFVVQGDQYGTSYFDVSPKFLGYHAHSAILTSLEMDHADFFNDFQDYKQAFKYFTLELPVEGILMSCRSYKAIKQIQALTKANKYSYFIENNEKNEYNNNLNSQFAFTAVNIRVQDRKQVGDLYIGNQKIGSLKTQLFGRYNMQNCLGVFGLAYLLGCKTEQILCLIESFKGMKRRQQVIFNGMYKNLNLTVLDDYAHHPTAVQVTIQGLKQKFDGRKLTVIYEFSSTSSTRKQFEEHYKRSFEKAECVVLKKFSVLSNSLSYLNLDYIVEQLKTKAIKAVALQSAMEIKQYLLQNIQNNQVVVFMSAKMFDYLPNELIRVLKNC